jgi:spermidine/putrescine transport system ATP-binding protein
MTARARTVSDTATTDYALPAIELIGVAKDYRVGKEVIAAVPELDLQITDGEFFSLLGPSGCGKSTTLRMIAGFEDVDRGVIRLHGIDVTEVGAHRRDLNMVFQGYALFPHLNVKDNIAFGLRRRKLGADEIRSRVAEAVALVGLGDRVTRMPRELSGGQQQRVALARALVNRPRALLLDEPLGALDLQLRQTMQIELKRIQREAGITFVYVTHDQSEALVMSDRIAVMNGGRIEQCGTPQNIYEHPATAFVANFIGTSNLITATATRGVDGELVVAAPDGDHIALPANPTRHAGAEVTFCVRPEKVTLVTQPPAQGNRLQGRITEVSYLGASTSYVVETALLKNFVVFEKNGPASVSYLRGDTVWLSWSTDSAHTFT